MSFIDANAKELGIEPICREMAVAPSSYHTHAARLADPDKRLARARRDDELGHAITGNGGAGAEPFWIVGKAADF